MAIWIMFALTQDTVIPLGMPVRRPEGVHARSITLPYAFASVHYLSKLLECYPASFAPGRSCPAGGRRPAAGMPSGSDSRGSEKTLGLGHFVLAGQGHIVLGVLANMLSFLGT